MNKILIIIPTYNEGENIVRLVDKIFSYDLGADILVVDDGKDNAADLIKRKQASRNDLFLIKRAEKSGRGSAVLRGIKFGLEKGVYEIFVEMDADFSHPPEELPGLIAAAGEGRAVLASRYVKGSKIGNWPTGRRIFSRIANLYAGIILGIGIHDYTNGFRAYHKSAALKLNFEKITASGYVVLSEIAHQLHENGVRLIELPTHFVNRNRGISNFSSKEVKEAFLSVLRIKGWRPLFIKAVSAVLLATAAFLSFFKLTQSPPIWTDEGIFIQAAMNLADSGLMGLQTAPGDILPSSAVTTGYPALYPIAMIFKYFGVGILQARIIAALYLLFAVLFFYRLAKNLFPPKIAAASLALLVVFPPLYGLGKSVLGEVPGMFFLLAFLFFISRIERADSRCRNFIFAGLAAGLCIATKPTFLVLLPAVFIAHLFSTKKIKIGFREAALFCISFLAPIAVWLKLQFGPADSFAGVARFYILPHALPDISQTIINNFLRFFKELSPAYFFATFACWMLAFLVRFLRKRKDLSLAEIIAAIFSILIFLAYLRTPGWYKNFFPAAILALLYFPASAYAIFKPRLAAVVMFLFIATGAYGLFFNSWTANNYNNTLGRTLHGYFAEKNYENVFVYNAPEAVVYLRTKNYYQFLEPANGLAIGDERLNYLREGEADFVIVGESFYNRDKIYFNKYKIKDRVDRFLVLEKI